MDLLEGVVRTYDWGSTDALAALIGHPPTGEPMAELWLGAHHRGAARVGSDGRRLDDVIRHDPEAMLGPGVARRFGTLPFLLKVLAAERPLSIQTHPSGPQSEAGFGREERAGIERDAPDRSFPDPVHKPELMCALAPFRALYGFRDPRDSLATVESLAVTELDPLRDQLAAGAVDLRSALRWLLTLEPDAAAGLTDVVVDAAVSRPEPRPPDQQLLVDLAAHHAGDVGVIVALLLNQVVLEPGQALFLAPGVLHSYVSGVGVEVMANSDNVVRGGLTSKPVDVASLLEIVDTEPVAPDVQDPAVIDGVARYHCPTTEFALDRIELESGLTVTVDGPSVLLCTAGVVDAGHRVLDRGTAAWIPACDPPVELTGRGTVFRAGVGADPEADDLH